MSDVSDKKVDWALALACVGILIGIPALVVACVYRDSANTSNTINIAAVAGQTDFTGNVTVQGTLDVAEVVPSSSPTTGSFTVAGGVGVGGQVVSALGFYGPVLDTRGGGALKIGGDYQTGLTLGREGIPVNVEANQFTAACNIVGRSFIPDVTDQRDLGASDKQMRRVYLAGRMFNASLFPTVGSAGIYTMVSEGDTLAGVIASPVSILGEVNKTSLDPAYVIPAESMLEGDAFEIKAVGTMVTTNTGIPTPTLTFWLTESTIISVPLPLPNAVASYVWNFEGVVMVRSAGQVGQMFGSGTFSVSSNDAVPVTVTARSQTTTSGFDTEDDQSWDMRLTNNHAAMTSFKALCCFLRKIY